MQKIKKAETDYYIDGKLFCRFLQELRTPFIKECLGVCGLKDSWFTDKSKKFLKPFENEEEEKALWLEYKKDHKNTTLRNKLLEKYMWFIFYEAVKSSHKTKHSHNDRNFFTELERTFSMFNELMVKAVERYKIESLIDGTSSSPTSFFFITLTLGRTRYDFEDYARGHFPNSATIQKCLVDAINYLKTYSETELKEVSLLDHKDMVEFLKKNNVVPHNMQDACEAIIKIVTSPDVYTEEKSGGEKRYAFEAAHASYKDKGFEEVDFSHDFEILNTSIIEHLKKKDAKALKRCGNTRAYSYMDAYAYYLDYIGIVKVDGKWTALNFGGVNNNGNERNHNTTLEYYSHLIKNVTTRERVRQIFQLIRREIKFVIRSDDNFKNILTNNYKIKAVLEAKSYDWNKNRIN